MSRPLCRNHLLVIAVIGAQVLLIANANPESADVSTPPANRGSLSGDRVALGSFTFASSESLGSTPASPPVGSTTDASDEDLAALGIHYRAPVEPPAAPAEHADAVIALRPFVVTAPKVWQDGPHETGWQTFVRTGMLAEHIGNKVTTRLSVKDDKGIMRLMLRFSW